MTKFDRKPSVSRKIFRVFNTLFFAFFILSILLPFLSVITQSLVNHNIYGLELFPFGKTDYYYDVNTRYKPNFIAYKFAFSNYIYLEPIKNTLFTTAAVSILGLFITCISAFILIQKNMPGRKIFAALLVLTFIIDAGMIPRFIVMRNLGLLDTKWAVIIPLSLNVFNIFLMRCYMESIPQSILDCAVLDGCTPFDTFIKIVLPLSKAALAAIGFFFAAAAWNEYLSYTIYMPRIDIYTRLQNIQYKLWNVFNSNEYGCGGYINIKTMQAAFTVISALPPILLSIFAQKYYTPVLNMASVKE